jgi:hypothetical protein
MSEFKNYLTQEDFLFIDEFIGKFDRPNFGFGFFSERAKSIGLPHKYDLPYIGISDEEPINDSLFDGYLGAYFRGNIDLINREGRIVLYRKNIKKLAINFAETEKKDLELSYNLIFRIVLAHELSHWMFHYCAINCDEEKCKTIDGINRLYANISSDLHEYIAQKMTREIFKIDPLFELSFNWLLKNQTEPYTVDILEDIEKIAAFKHFLICGAEKNTIIQDALNKGEIDYDCFKALLNQKRGAITGKRYGL